MAGAHAGHRERVKRRVRLFGLESLMPHEVIEYLLYFSIPRRDVNLLAHALIDRFGSVHGVLGAAESELMSVSGVGLRTARWLGALRRAVDSYSELSLVEKPRLHTRARMEAYARELHLTDPLSSDAWLVLLNSGGHLMFTGRLSSSVYWASEQSVYSAVTASLSYMAHSAVVVIYRASPSEGVGEYDKQGVAALSARLSAVDVNFIDFMLIYPDSSFSMRRVMEMPVPREQKGVTAIREDWLSEDYLR